MGSKSVTQNGLTLRLYQGDFKTLVAYSLADKKRIKNLAGFTLSFLPQDGATTKPYYIYNNLQFEKPRVHAQVLTEPANSSINAPIHYFRWVHVPGSLHQDDASFEGVYTYTVVPRYFDGTGSMLAIDPGLGASLDIEVGPFKKGKLGLGVTRGFMQSQAFVHRFGPKAVIRPKELLYDTSKEAGKDPRTGKAYTYADEYAWLGFSARKVVFGWLDEVFNNSNLSVDVFAYDLNEPDVLKKMVALAKEGRIRVILDNAVVHHGSPPTREDQFEKEFNKAAKAPAVVVRGHFARYAHDKVFIVYEGQTAKKVLTGSTNLAVTGMYVNSNHVVTVEDGDVAKQYAKVFNDSLTLVNQKGQYAKTADAGKTFTYALPGISKVEITFSPHTAADATKILAGIAARVDQELTAVKGNVLFAVMELDSSGPATEKLRSIHNAQNIFSYGITDTTKGIKLYKPGTKTGVLVTGKPANTFLPPPFDQVPGVGIGHQVHHKFVVCGFNRPDGVVYCGSSNLATSGEADNGDNLLAIHDGDVATAFAIEALTLVDHFHFLNKSQKPGKKVKVASKPQLAAAAGWFLSTTDGWVKPYYDPNDLKCADRELFGGS